MNNPIEHIERTKDKITIMQAYANGEELQFKYRDTWKQVNTPNWDWVQYDYRIKPEPLEIWVNTYPGNIAAHSTEKSAIKTAKGNALYVAVHMREVIDDET